MMCLVPFLSGNVSKEPDGGVQIVHLVEFLLGTRHIIACQVTDISPQN